MSRTTRIATTALLLIWAAAATQPRAQVADDPIWANPLETGVPSPTAAEIGNVALSDVAHQTGALQLSIPLFELPTRSGMTIPITLSYSSNGVKVDDVAGWVGMGWTLHAGGAVTRSVRGLPDEEPKGYPFQGRQDAEAIWSGLIQGQSASGHEVLTAIWQGNTDTQPDLFAFSTPGPSGRFIWAAEEEFVPIPYQPVAINDTGRDADGILGWEITAPDGSRYVFGDAGDLGGREMTTTIGTTDITITEAHSSWMLAKIIPPTGNDQDDFVSFRYSGPHPTDLMQPLWEERISGCGYTERYGLGTWVTDQSRYMGDTAAKLGGSFRQPTARCRGLRPIPCSNAPSSSPPTRAAFTR